MSERGRRLELCSEWGNGTDGGDFEGWLMDKVIDTEAERDQLITSLQELREKVVANEQDAAKGTGAYWAGKAQGIGECRISIDKLLPVEPSEVKS